MRDIIAQPMLRLFAGLFLMMALLLFPLRIALSEPLLKRAGIAAQEISGSIWLGKLDHVQFGGIPIGTLSAGLSPLGLFIGDARFAFRRTEGSSEPFEGEVIFSTRATDIVGATLTLPTKSVFAPLRVDSLRLDDVTVRFSNGRCESAEGRVHAHVGSDLGASSGEEMSGNMRCRGEVVEVLLQSRSGMEQITLKVRQDGHFNASLLIRPNDAVQDQAMSAAGFHKVPAGYLFSKNGQF